MVSHKFVPGLLYERIENGWKHHQPDGCTIVYYDLEDSESTKLRSSVNVGHTQTGSEPDAIDRINKLEAMVTDVLRQLANARAANREIRENHSSDVAATDTRMNRLSGIIDEEGKILREQMESGRRGLIYRLDQQDKEIADIRAKANAAIGLRARGETRGPTPIERRLEALETARAWIDTTSVYERMQSIETMLTGVNGLSQRIGDLHKRMDKIDNAKELAKAIETLAPKMASLQPKTWWLNVYPEGGWQATRHRSRAEADRFAGMERIACVMFCEGEGLSR